MKNLGEPILCGTDFSLHAAEAANVAAAIAARLKRTLILVHVRKNGRVTQLPGAGQRLHREAERLRAQGTNVRELLLSGTPHEKIVEEAVRARACMIIVSSIGAATVRNLVIGSVAERVAESSPVPALVVRNGPLLEAWARGDAVLKILLGYDFSASSEAALFWLSSLKEIGRCDVTVQYIAWPPEESSRRGLHYGAWWGEMPPGVQQLIERDLKERVGLFGDDLKTRVEPSWGRADLKLIDLARAEDFGILVVGTHQRHGVGRIWLGSTSRGVLHHAPMSVAVVPKSPPELDPPIIPLLRRILVTTDLADAGNAAVPYAFSLLPRGGVVKIIHVLPELRPSRVPATVREQKRRTNDAKRKLKSLIPPEAESSSVSAEISVLYSARIAHAIATEAERFGADAICIASHGHSALARTVFGCTTRSVIKLTRRPVLVIRAPEP